MKDRLTSGVWDWSAASRAVMNAAKYSAGVGRGLDCRSRAPSRCFCSATISSTALRMMHCCTSHDVQA
jgi:hypothetical protein